MSWFARQSFPVQGMAFLMVCALVLSFLMRKSSTGARKLREGRVTGIVGRKGHGKTIFSVHEILRHLNSPPTVCPDPACNGVRHKRVVASNGTLRLPDRLLPQWYVVKGWGDVVQVLGPEQYTSSLPHGTLVVIDEAGTPGWCPAIAGQQLPGSVSWYLAQCRKFHHEVLWIAQHESRVSAGLRAQTDEIGLCQKGYFRAMKVRFFDPEDIGTARKKGKAVWTFRYKVTKRLGSAYNTYGLIAAAVKTDDAVRAPAGRSKPGTVDAS